VQCLEPAISKIFTENDMYKPLISLSGSTPLKTFLPNGDIDINVIIGREARTSNNENP
jgi:hypothetical protein